MRRFELTPGCPPWELIELAVRVPVVDGIATLRNAITGTVNMPLLTSIEAPPGSVLVCDGARMDAAGFVTCRPESWRLWLEAPGCSDNVREFFETLSASQVEAMPAFLDWMHYDDVAVQLPENCSEEAVVVRGLNQVNMVSPRYWVKDSAENCGDVVVRGLNPVIMMEPRYWAYESCYYRYS